MAPKQNPMPSPYPRFFLQHRDRIERAATWRGRRYWVVGRSLCGFRLFPLANVGRTNLKDVAALKAREWAPYPELGFHVHLTRDAARIWVWDGARVRDAMLSMGVRPGRVTVLPETALQARGADGLQLIDCLEGVEGQFWSEGELKASRWWAETPSPGQWLEFQRATGMVVHALPQVPPAEQPVWRGQPWTSSGEGLRLERRGREAAVVVAGTLLAAYVYLAGSLAHDALSVSDVENRLVDAQRRSAPVLADREAALANLDFLGGFAKLDPYPPQPTVLARVAEKLPSNGAQLAAWSYQQGDLQFTVFSPISPPDILFYVKTYSSVEGFTDVTAERAEGDRSLRVKLHLAQSKP
jgi:hypothetical protein